MSSAPFLRRPPSSAAMRNRARNIVIKKHVFFAVVTFLCALVSFVGYCSDGNIPVLQIIFGRIYAGAMRGVGTLCRCRCQRGRNDLTVSNPTPFIAAGPSKVQEIIPLNVLKKKVDFSKLKGLSDLDHVSLSRYYQCQPASMLLLPSNHNEKRCKEMTFWNRKGPIVALVSFHGSGNTWVRHLLEQATGIFTGSIYCDGGLKIVFPGESICSGNVIAVKTHHTDTRDLPKDIQMATGKQRFDKAILIVRNPFDALLSEANRRWNFRRSVNSHIGIADETAFISNSKWDWFVEYKGIAWSFLLHTWLAQNDTPVHIVQYENLQTNLHEELVHMLSFLNFPASKETINCAVKNSNGKFKRVQHLNFDPYSKENREAVNRVIQQAAPLLANHGIKYTPR